MELYIDNVKLPTPAESGLSITPNKCWSSNAGRNSSTGKFVGDIIAVKYTVAITYETLSDADMQKLWNLTATAQAWHTLQFPLNGKAKKIIGYVADPTYVMRRFDMQKKQAFYDGVTIEIIEQ